MLQVPMTCNAPDTKVTKSNPMLRKRMNRYGITADTRKCRLLIATRWKKITDMAFSSTLKTSALRKSIVKSSAAPTTSRCFRNVRSSSTNVLD